MKFVIVLAFCVQQTLGVIYNLNETEYDRLPPLFHLDSYYPCLRTSGDIYCYLDAKLVANGTSELLTIIQEYSTNDITHYDHTLLHWGICVTKTCRDHLGPDLSMSLEACLNHILTTTYQLQTRVLKEKNYCTKFGESNVIDIGDIVVAVTFITILILNVFGSLYEFYGSSKHTLVGRFLSCFSVKSNWRRLVAPSGEGPDPKLRRLKCFNGIKAFTTFLVVMGHSPLLALITSNNPQFIETTYNNPIYYIFYNGNLIVQSFFIMSGFLLAFNILIAEEKMKITWMMVPKGIVLRWLRLTPPFAAVLAFVATWLRHFGDGPLWKPVVGVEIQDCRRDWFYSLLYLNNYVDHSQCMAHTWYLAADMQLTVLGLLIFCLLPTTRARKTAVAVAFAIGLATPALQSYLQNLRPRLLLTPEVARQYFVEDPTFNNSYKRTHTNLVCYAMGLALGLWVYNLHESNFDVQKYKKYRFVYWATLPFGLLLIMAGGVFYMDNIQVPIAARLAYSSAVNPLFGLIGFILVPGTIFKLENVYRSVLEWRGWISLGRVSYCAYLVHECVIRTSTANHTSLTHANFYQIFLNYCGLLVITFMVAVPCWMLVEAPFGQLVKLCLNPGPRTIPEKVSKVPNQEGFRWTTELG